jgi:hypothetical protein
MPSIQEQLESARSGGLVVPAVELGVLVATGPDRVKWLNGLLTCELANRKPGEAVYGLAVGQKGKILCDVVVVLEAERLGIALPATEREAMRAWLDHHLIMEDAELGASEESVLFVHGPRSAELLDAARGAGASGAPFDRTGLGGAVVLTPPEKATAVRAALEGAGAVFGDEAGWDALRHERFVPRFGVDFDTATYPQEASLEKVAVSFDKGCYLGQEVVFMLEKRGHVKKKLVPLRLEDGEVPAKGAAVATPAGDAVGEVTSAARTPSGVIAFAMVKRAHTPPDTELRVGEKTAKVIAAGDVVSPTSPPAPLPLGRGEPRT